MEPWEKRLAHAKVCRDALVACGNPAPKEPDPKGGLMHVICQRFDGKTFFKHLNERGHTDAEYERCLCSKKGK